MVQCYVNPNHGAEDNRNNIIVTYDIVVVAETSTM